MTTTGEATNNNVASGDFSHAEGFHTEAIGNYSHAEGTGSSAYGIAAHAQGAQCSALANNTFSTGDHCNAAANNSEACGSYGQCQWASGQSRGGGNDFDIGGSQVTRVTLSCSIAATNTATLHDSNGVVGSACVDNFSYRFIYEIVISKTGDSAICQAFRLRVLCHVKAGSLVIDSQATTENDNPAALGITAVATGFGFGIVVTLTNPAAFAVRAVASVESVEVNTA